METSATYVTFDLPILNGKIDTTRILHMTGADYKHAPNNEVIERGLDNETARVLYTLVDVFAAEGVIEFSTFKAAEAYVQGGSADLVSLSSENPVFLVIPFYKGNDNFTHAVASSFDYFAPAVTYAFNCARASKERLKYGVFELTSIYVLSRSVKGRN